MSKATMRRRTWLWGAALVWLAASFANLAAVAIAADTVEATHNQLRALRDGISGAFNRLGSSGDEKDLDAVLQFVHKNVVLNAMNGDRAVGHDGVREMFRKSMVGVDRSVQSVHHEFNVDALSVLHGDDTAIAYGTTKGKYVLAGGVNLEVDANWLAALVREDGKWLVAGFQFGPSIFDNPIAKQLQRTLYWAAGGTGLLGILLGYFIGRRRARRPAQDL
jgi:ketosteroid isomerase-like protein